MTEVEREQRWASVKACAAAENAAMKNNADNRRTSYGGLADQFGIVNFTGRPKGGPIMSGIRRSKPAQELLRLAEQGFTVPEASRITASPEDLVRQRAERYRIPFRGGCKG